MQTVLFHSTIFGPIHSRRLGSSLGINLMPDDGKICSFDCIYCEAGYNAQGHGTTGLPARAQVAAMLEQKLGTMKTEGTPLDVITFSGNGEPTLHPEFEGVIDDTIALRDRYFPNVKISVLSNATRLGSESVCRALARVDNNILKLDSTVPSTVALLDRPVDPSTMLTRGTHEGITVDNTTDAEIDALIEAYGRIKPREIMLYTIDRPTPEISLKRVSREELAAAGARITRRTGIPVQISG